MLIKSEDLLKKYNYHKNDLARCPETGFIDSFEHWATICAFGYSPDCYDGSHDKSSCTCEEQFKTLELVDSLTIKSRKLKKEFTFIGEGSYIYLQDGNSQCKCTDGKRNDIKYTESKAGDFEKKCRHWYKQYISNTKKIG